MSWTTDRTTVLAAATSAGTALAALYTSAKSALSSAQIAADPTAEGFDLLEVEISKAIEAAVAAAGVQPGDLRRMLRFAGIAARNGG